MSYGGKYKTIKHQFDSPVAGVLLSGDTKILSTNYAIIAEKGKKM